jgi:hypothetical protein
MRRAFVSITPKHPLKGTRRGYDRYSCFVVLAIPRQHKERQYLNYFAHEWRLFALGTELAPLLTVVRIDAQGCRITLAQSGLISRTGTGRKEKNR